MIHQTIVTNCHIVNREIQMDGAGGIILLKGQNLKRKYKPSRALKCPHLVAANFCLGIASKQAKGPEQEVQIM